MLIIWRSKLKYTLKGHERSHKVNFLCKHPNILRCLSSLKSDLIKFGMIANMIRHNFFILWSLTSKDNEGDFFKILWKGFVIIILILMKIWVNTKIMKTQKILLKMKFILRSRWRSHIWKLTLKATCKKKIHLHSYKHQLTLLFYFNTFWTK